MEKGFITVASAVPAVKVADTEFNVKEAERLIEQAEKSGVEIIVFPELSVTGYSCQDLFAQQILLDCAEKAVRHLLSFTKDLGITCIVGAPVVVGTQLYNCAVRYRDLRRHLVAGAVQQPIGFGWCRHHIQSFGKRRIYRQTCLLEATPVAAERTPYCRLCV